MSPANKYSLILMHDDGRTRRLRVRVEVWRLLMGLVLFLVFAGAAGIWIGWQAWGERQRWESARYELQRELAECRVSLERLSNMQALYEHSRSAVLPASSGEGALSPQGVSRDMSANATSSAASPVTAPASANGTLPASSAPASAASVPSVNATLPAEQASSATPEETVAVNTGVVRVENVLARLDDRRRMRIVVDLYNGDSTGQQISGKVVFTLLDADGQEYPISSENTVFRIVRFKKMVVATSLPTGVADAENAAMRVEVFVDDKLEFRQIYPVESR